MTDLRALKALLSSLPDEYETTEDKNDGHGVLTVELKKMHEGVSHFVVEFMFDLDDRDKLIAVDARSAQ